MNGATGPRLAAILAAAVAASLFGSGCGSGGEDPSDARLQAVVDGLTQDIFVGDGLTGQKQLFHVPGSALTVESPDDGSRTFISGAARLEGEHPLDSDGIQPVGSNTKVVTAALIMRLVEKGRLKVDEKLPAVAARYRRDGGALAKLVRTYRDRLNDVTLRELLNHTSGLTDCLDTKAFFESFARQPLAKRSLSEMASYGLAQPPVFKPGAPGKWNYSNTDYMLLGMVLEAVSGYSVEQEMANLFDQLGMNHTHYAPSVSQLRRGAISRLLIDGYQGVGPPGTTPPELTKPFRGVPTATVDLKDPRSVQVVSSNPSESGPTVKVTPAGPRQTRRVERHNRFKFQNVTDAYSLSIAQSAGGIVSDTGDLAVFWRKLFDGEIVSEETLHRMEQTVPTGENSKGVKVTWGLGFGRQEIAPDVLWRGSPHFTVWMHLGDIFGWESAAYYVPQENLVVTNTDNLFPTPVGDLGLLRDVLRVETRKG